MLVVDSDPDSCELLTALFAQYGIETTIATCAREAIEQIQQAQPDLLISEIFLPDEDGYSLIRQVKILETTLHVQIPAIALTTVFSEERDRIYTSAAGFCRYLLKPFDIDTLMTTIACLTGKAQYRAANACC
ncbi:response regulator (plasmid) [Kovacikia minuta CCNUW1]|uniref:response regulator n=1 Tax=Kovacikia minuta TaxID=2931930 RepID=UPI001CCC8845|nr:response regulator [Kovacikia minuta]UBF30440.1 response regulator [Kovacikia minuta CCNUW1]